jgi:hypothetical protein
MSENWKNDRAESSMREADAENMKKALIKLKAKEDAEWDAVKINLYQGDSNYDGHVDSIIDGLRKLYKTPTLKNEKK